MEYHHFICDPHYTKNWDQCCANELGCLAQGLGDNMKGTTNTLFFIPRSKVPLGHIVTYPRIVCTVRPEKDEHNQTRITCRQNLILDYPRDVSTKTASLETFKMHLNSVVSTPGAKYMTMDISNMYLNTPLDQYEYMWMKLSDIPQQIIDQYNLNNIFPWRICLHGNPPRHVRPQTIQNACQQRTQNSSCQSRILSGMFRSQVNHSLY